MTGRPYDDHNDFVRVSHNTITIKYKCTPEKFFRAKEATLKLWRQAK